MSETTGNRASDADQLRRDGESHQPYLSPQITDMGTFYDLTRQQLKVSGSADFVSFQPSHP